MRACDDRYILRLDNDKVYWNVSHHFDYNEKIKEGRRMQLCAFGACDADVILFENGESLWRGLTDRHSAKLKVHSLSFVSLGPQNQMFVRYSHGKFSWVDGPDETMVAVNCLSNKGHDIRAVHMGGEHGDEYIVRYS